MIWVHQTMSDKVKVIHETYWLNGSTDISHITRDKHDHHFPLCILLPLCVHKQKIWGTTKIESASPSLLFFLLSFPDAPKRYKMRRKIPVWFTERIYFHPALSHTHFSLVTDPSSLIMILHMPYFLLLSLISSFWSFSLLLLYSFLPFSLLHPSVSRCCYYSREYMRREEQLIERWGNWMRGNSRSWREFIIIFRRRLPHHHCRHNHLTHKSFSWCCNQLINCSKGLLVGTQIACRERKGEIRRERDMEYQASKAPSGNNNKSILSSSLHSTATHSIVTLSIDTQDERREGERDPRIECRTHNTTSPTQLAVKLSSCLVQGIQTRISKKKRGILIFIQAILTWDEE